MYLLHLESHLEHEGADTCNILHDEHNLLIMELPSMIVALDPKCFHINEQTLRL